MITRTLNGEIPWSVTTKYDGGRLGSVGVASAAGTVAEALEQAKEWARTHQPRREDLYLTPSTEVAIGYRSLFDVTIRDILVDAGQYK